MTTHDGSSIDVPTEDSVASGSIQRSVDREHACLQEPRAYKNLAAGRRKWMRYGCTDGVLGRHDDDVFTFSSLTRNHSIMVAKLNTILRMEAFGLHNVAAVAEQ